MKAVAYQLARKALAFMPGMDSADGVAVLVFGF